MLIFIIRRLLIMVPFLFLISIVSFIVIQLPPGSFVDSYVTNLRMMGGTVNADQVESIKALYGLDKPLLQQYLIWISKIVLHGNFGNSFRYNRPVADILMERVPLTMAISLSAIVLTWIFAVPLAILS